MPVAAHGSQQLRGELVDVPAPARCASAPAAATTPGAASFARAVVSSV